MRVNYFRWFYLSAGENNTNELFILGMLDIIKHGKKGRSRPNKALFLGTEFIAKTIQIDLLKKSVETFLSNYYEIVIYEDD